MRPTLQMRQAYHGFDGIAVRVPAVDAVGDDLVTVNQRAVPCRTQFLVSERNNGDDQEATPLRPQRHRIISGPTARANRTSINMTPMLTRVTTAIVSFFSSSISAPGSRTDGPEGGDGTERKKDRAKNGMIRSPRDGCAEQRQGGQEDKAVYCLGVHFRSRFEGAASRGVPPLCARRRP